MKKIKVTGEKYSSSAGAFNLSVLYNKKILKKLLYFLANVI